jgi:uncharacterized membrane protein
MDMNNFLKFVQVFALGTWVGSILYFSFAVAQVAFSVLSSRDQAGLMVGQSLSRLHAMGMIAAVLYLVAGVALAGSLRTFTAPATIGVVLMLLLTAVSQTYVTHRMADLRREMVSIDATPKESALRVEFDKLHAVSVQLEGAILLIGVAALYFTVRTKPM